MPTPNSDTEGTAGGESTYVLLLIIAAAFFAIAIVCEYAELSSHYNWPSGPGAAATGAP
jgi:hypothetical protein